MDKLCDLLDIRPGVTALIGGGGKTTLCHLLSRFWDVDGGQVTLGRHGLKTVLDWILALRSPKL